MSPLPRWQEGPGTAGEAFVCAFAELRPALLSALHVWLGNYEDAQDVAQDAFLKCWRSRDQLPAVRNLQAWIFRVGRNSAKDLQRNAYRRRSRPLVANGARLSASADSPERVAEDREAQERLRRALLDLRSDEREVFLLRQNGCWTYDEIAANRRIPVGTIKNQMRTALAKLRRALREE
jgi:RNA polymerase sigma-70 factor (ECF subfamily)